MYTYLHNVLYEAVIAGRMHNVWYMTYVWTRSENHLLNAEYMGISHPIIAQMIQA